jgi:hypothetical protein
MAAIRSVVLSAAAATCTVKIHNPAITFSEDGCSLIAADGRNFRTTEEAVYDIIDSGMNPDTAIMPTMDQDRPWMTDAMWVKNIIEVCDRILEFEAMGNDAEAGLFGD